MARTSGRTVEFPTQPAARTAEVVREYGPFPGADVIHADLFYCGGGPSGKVRAVRKPRA
jgi:hypothetical protein